MLLALHTVVDGKVVVSVIPDTWVILSTIAAAVVALLTGVLAGFTWNLARQTKKLADQTTQLAEQTKKLAEETTELAKDTLLAADLSDRHHRESLIPIVVFTGYFYLEEDAIVDGVAGPAVHLKGEVVNNGLGPALHVRMSTFTVGGGFLVLQVPFPITGVLAARDSYKFERAWRTGSMHGFSEGETLPFSMLIDYASMFNEAAYSAQNSANGDAAEAQLTYTPPPIAPRPLMQ